jgi:hypothetical protein
MIFKCSSCHFKSDDLDELMTHHDKTHLQKKDVNEDKMATRDRNAPLEVIMFDSEDDESDDESEEDGSDRNWRKESWRKDKKGIKRKSGTKNQSSKTKENIKKRQWKKEQQLRENEILQKETIKRRSQEEADINMATEGQRREDEGRKRLDDSDKLLEVEKRNAEKKRKKEMGERGRKALSDINRQAQLDIKKIMEASMKRAAEEEEGKDDGKKRRLEEPKTERMKAQEKRGIRLTEEAKKRNKTEDERRAEEKIRGLMQLEGMKRLREEAKKSKTEETEDKRKELLGEARKKALQRKKVKDEAEKKRIEESMTMHCTMCSAQVPSKSAFQIHLFGSHDELWCERCNFVGNTADMTNHLQNAHGHVMHQLQPNYSGMVKWNAQDNQESDGIITRSLPSPTSSTSSGIGSMAPVVIKLNPKYTDSSNDKGLVFKCRRCSFNTDNLVEHNRHVEEDHVSKPQPTGHSPAHVWRCHYCFIQVDSVPSLKVHMKKCPDRQKEEGGGALVARYICPFCDRLINDKERLINHLSDRDKFSKCTKKNCAFVACSEKDHREHLEMYHWQCLQCDFNTTLEAIFTVHTALSGHSKDESETSKKNVPQRRIASIISKKSTNSAKKNTDSSRKKSDTTKKNTVRAKQKKKTDTLMKKTVISQKKTDASKKVLDTSEKDLDTSKKKFAISKKTSEISKKKTETLKKKCVSSKNQVQVLSKKKSVMPKKKTEKKVEISKKKTVTTKKMPKTSKKTGTLKKKCVSLSIAEINKMPIIVSSTSLQQLKTELNNLGTQLQELPNKTETTQNLKISSAIAKIEMMPNIVCSTSLQPDLGTSSKTPLKKKIMTSKPEAQLALSNKTETNKNLKISTTITKIEKMPIIVSWISLHPELGASAETPLKKKSKVSKPKAQQALSNKTETTKNLKISSPIAKIEKMPIIVSSTSLQHELGASAETPLKKKSKVSKPKAQQALLNKTETTKNLKISSPIAKMPIIVCSTSLQQLKTELNNSKNFIGPAAALVPEDDEVANTIIPCPSCRSTFPSNDQWFCHIMNAHPESVTSTCLKCHCSFEGPIALEKHNDLTHKNEDLRT